MSSSARFDELKKKFDENPRRYFAPLATEFRKSGDAEQAVMICEEFLPQQPGHMSGHIVYGQALFDLGRLDDARTVFETALTLDPENLIALRHLGDIARAHGDLESARTWYQRVLEADPRNEEVQALVASLDASASGAAPHAPSTPEAPVPGESSFEPPTPALAESATTVELESVYELTIDAPPPLPAAPAPATESLLDLDVVDEDALGGASSAGQAEGFEAMEFTAPPASSENVAGIADELEPGEFSAPQGAVAPLDGLEETAIGAFEARPSPAAPAPPPALPDLEPTFDVDARSAVDQPPVDIPPEVIAAEAELIDAREAESISSASTGERGPGAAASPSAAPAQPLPPRVTPSQPFVTETMAELYMKQGFREQALDVYKLLLAASPESQRLRDRVAELQPRAEVDAGPNVREFFARIAARRPGDGGASSVPPAPDDFASLDSFETVPESTSAAAAPTPPDAAPAAAPELSGLPMLDDEPVGDARQSVPSESSAPAPSEGAGEGSIDALFGQRPVGPADASAASALAQAFGNAADDAPPISGRPARAAAGELSLDSVFRDGGARPPRNAQSFSFDQFFSESAASEPAAEPGPAPTPSQGTSAQNEAAERNPDDIEQFNSWLQGLKQR